MFRQLGGFIGLYGYMHLRFGEICFKFFILNLTICDKIHSVQTNTVTPWDPVGQNKAYTLIGVYMRSRVNSYTSTSWGLPYENWLNGANYHGKTTYDIAKFIKERKYTFSQYQQLINDIKYQLWTSAGWTGWIKNIYLQCASFTLSFGRDVKSRSVLPGALCQG